MHANFRLQTSLKLFLSFFFYFSKKNIIIFLHFLYHINHFLICKFLLLLFFYHKGTFCHMHSPAKFRNTLFIFSILVLYFYYLFLMYNWNQICTFLPWGYEIHVISYIQRMNILYKVNEL